MSIEEIKAVVDNATEEERLFLAAYLRVKRDGGKGPLGVALAKANEGLLRGEGVSFEELQKQLGQSEEA